MDPLVVVKKVAARPKHRHRNLAAAGVLRPRQVPHVVGLLQAVGASLPSSEGQVPHVAVVPLVAVVAVGPLHHRALRATIVMIAEVMMKPRCLEGSRHGRHRRAEVVARREDGGRTLSGGVNYKWGDNTVNDDNPVRLGYQLQLVLNLRTFAPGPLGSVLLRFRFYCLVWGWSTLQSVAVGCIADLMTQYRVMPCMLGGTCVGRHLPLSHLSRRPRLSHASWCKCATCLCCAALSALSM